MVGAAHAGVWRRKTIMTVGGWQSRTTVEDMDLSLRTYVNGWKAVYLADVTCLNEVRPLWLASWASQQGRRALSPANQGPSWELCRLAWHVEATFGQNGSQCWCGLPGTAVSRLHAEHARLSGEA